MPKRLAPNVYQITNGDALPFNVHTTEERMIWAMAELMKAGPKGCTPIDNPAPRWSSYVHNWKAEGADIETVTEKHHGRFQGTHARYVLRSNVILLRGTASDYEEAA